LSIPCLACTQNSVHIRGWENPQVAASLRGSGLLHCWRDCSGGTSFRNPVHPAGLGSERRLGTSVQEPSTPQGFTQTPGMGNEGHLGRGIQNGARGANGTALPAVSTQLRLGYKDRFPPLFKCHANICTEAAADALLRINSWRRDRASIVHRLCPDVLPAPLNRRWDPLSHPARMRSCFQNRNG